MKEKSFSIFRRITILIFALITILGVLFILLTYYATNHYHLASTQLLNKDVAAHIAKFASPYNKNGVDKRRADSVFKNAMVISPSAEVYFLDTIGNVLDFYGPKEDILLQHVTLVNINKYIGSNGQEYIKGPDPRDPSNPKIFSAAKVLSDSKNLGYIYVILGSNEYKNVSEMLSSSHVGNLVITAFFFIIVLSIAISVLYINRLQKGYNSMLNVLNKFQDGDFSSRFKTKASDEFEPVSKAFNKMADLLVYNINRLTDLENIRKDFISHISHDLRTPLSIARGYTETLLIKKDDNSVTRQERESYNQMILNKILQVEHMVTQLFDLSKMESANFNLKSEPFVLSEIVQETVNTFQLSVKEKQVNLKCTQCQYHVWINADVSMMERVIQNLIENAVKDTFVNGTIQVSIEVQSNDLMFKITNTGDPLPHALLEWINTPEKQHGSYENRPSKSGLGLMIVRRILYLHGSSLKAYTSHNSENVFTFSVPIIRP